MTIEKRKLAEEMLKKKAQYWITEDVPMEDKTSLVHYPDAISAMLAFEEECRKGYKIKLLENINAYEFEQQHHPIRTPNHLSTIKAVLHWMRFYISKAI